MPTRRVINRPDRVVTDDAQLIVRFGRDVDVQNALRIALGVSGLYRVVPGYEASGAVCISAFLVANEDEAVMLLTDTTWEPLRAVHRRRHPGRRLRHHRHGRGD